MRWFRPPPKVRIVLGILGPPPSLGTRVAHPDGGELKVSIACDAGHRPSLGCIPNPVDSDCDISPNPNLIPKSSSPSSRTLAKFVKHLWKDVAPRSFASVVRAEYATVVKVAMQSYGDGHRGGSRPGREGFSGKKQGWGGGRSTIHINTWKCKDGEAHGENQAVLEQEKSADAERERNQVNSN